MSDLGDRMASAYFRGDVREMTDLVFEYARATAKPSPPLVPPAAETEASEEDTGTGE